MTDSTELASSSTSKLGRRRRFGRWLVILWVALVVLVVCLTLASRNKTETQNTTPKTYVSNSSDTTNYVAITAQVLDVDPTSDQMQVRITLRPVGSYARTDGTLAVPLQLNVDGVPGGQDSFEAGHSPVPVESTLSLVGDLGQYPFDSYTSSLVVEVSRPNSTKLIPIRLTTTGGQRDWAIAPSASAIRNGNALTTTIGVRRGNASIGFAMFELVLMAILAAIALAITYTTVIVGRPLEFSYFTWLGALIFALPAVRSALPGNPPIGTLGTVIFFFPALATVTVCMLVAAITFVHRAHLRG